MVSLINVPKKFALGKQGETSTDVASPQSSASPDGALQTHKILNFKRIFSAFVLLPTLVTAFYMFAIAAEQFQSESKFVIKAADSQSSGGLSSILLQTGFGSSFSNANTVVEYLNSRDALQAINKDAKFENKMMADGADFWARYPGRHFSMNFENLYKYYLRKTDVFINPTTDIIELRVNAFSATDAQEIATDMLGAARIFIEQLNSSLRNDALQTASGSVTRAEQRLLEIQSKISSLRVEQELIDPQLSVKASAETIQELSGQLITVELEIASLDSLAEDSPRINALKKQRDNIKAVIAKQRSEQVSGTDGKFASAIDEFSRLSLEQEFAAKSLAAARAGYESARLETIRQQVYLVNVVEPNLPDRSAFPKRFEITITVFAIFLGIFIIAWLFLANLREHAE